MIMYMGWKVKEMYALDGGRVLEIGMNNWKTRIVTKREIQGIDLNHLLFVINSWQVLKHWCEGSLLLLANIIFSPPFESLTQMYTTYKWNDIENINLIVSLEASEV